MWVAKYIPREVDELQGQDTALQRLRGFISHFSKEKKKAALLYGPYGTGKTGAVYVLAKELGLEVVELNASDFRNKDIIQSVVGSAMAQRSLFFKGKIILIDEIDGLSGAKDRGGVQALSKLLGTTSFPVVMTAHNPYEQKLSDLRKKSELIEFHTLRYTSIVKILKRICSSEDIKFEEAALTTLARRAGGDARAAINDLETLSQESKRLAAKDIEALGDRSQIESMQNALIKVFKTLDSNVARRAFDNVDEDLDKVMLWIDENLHKEYSGKDLARAYDALSRADVFKGRIIRRQNWGFLATIYPLLGAGIAVAKDEKQKGFVQYKPTTRIFKIWRANMANQKKKAIAAKLAEATHTSTRRAMESIPYLKVIFRDKRMAKGITDQLELDKEEAAWLAEA